MRVVIPSKGRVTSCAQAARLFDDPLIVVREDEVDDYAPLGLELLAHPLDVRGIGPLKRWILANVPDETVVIIDDDVSKVLLLVGQRLRPITRPDSIAQILANAETVARALDTPIFGFNQAWDLRKFTPQDPLHLYGWTGSVVGIIGREINYDPNLLLRADIDLCLQAMRQWRTVFIDLRFAFVHERFTGQGGNAYLRSKKRNEKELQYLQEKWGKWLRVQETKTTTRLLVRVKRRQWVN
jgi:hypothetical protein